MSVTTEGIKGYEYQYKVTVLVALKIKAEKIKLYVEKKDGEDFFLEIENECSKLNVDIQVKREENAIDIPKLVNWLNHYHERKADRNLLQVLLDNNQNFAMFITKSRCSDSTVFLKASLENIKEHVEILIDKDWLRDFKKNLQGVKLGKSILMKNREENSRNQANKLKSISDIVPVLKRCLIIEELTDSKIDMDIKSILNSYYNVAQSNSDYVYLHLLEIVRHGRDTGKEIYKQIIEHVLSNQIGLPNIYKHYKTRNEEKYLFEIIEEKKVLLLTGISQCGKTELGKTIALHYVKQGYDFRITDNINEMVRFTNSNISDNKIVILEDPFGHLTLIENHFDMLRKLKDQISHKERHHLLIVTSRIEIIYEIFNTISIDKCKLDNHNWIDLTVKNQETILSFWNDFTKRTFIPDDIGNFVNQGISQSRSIDLLQIGQLAYLLNEDLSSLHYRNFSELEHVARRNSVEIANALKQTNQIASDVLSILSICSTTIHALAFKDLAFILSTVENYPSIIDNVSFITYFGDDEKPEFPEYPKGIKLDSEILKAINFLEEKGFVTLSGESVLIKHPDYYEAGRYLFFERGSVNQSRKLDQMRKCLSCLNSLTAYLASKNLCFIYKKIDDKFKQTILGIAFHGLNSIFPAVEDSTLVFLINESSDLSKEQFSVLVKKMQNGETKSSYMYWNSNIPFKAQKGGMHNFFSLFDSSTSERVRTQLQNRTLPNKHDGWIFINSLQNSDCITLEELEILLQFDEVFIRIEVVKNIFQRPHIVDKRIVTKLFNDENPSLVFSVIRASLLNWFSLPSELKEYIIELSIASLLKKSVAIRTYNLIMTFSIDYSNESVYSNDLNEAQKKEFWKIWAKYFDACLSCVPIEVIMNSARFGVTIDTAVKYLELESGLLALNAWYSRIDLQIKNDLMLDEFEMAIADSLMKLTGDDFDSRRELFTKIISYQNTNFLITNLKWFLNYWPELNSLERNAISKLIEVDRKDKRWIKAMLLTSNSPPADLVQVILGDVNAFCMEPYEFLSKFDSQLLKDCLNFYCGFPQPLYWLATHHHNTEFWNEIIKYILLDENHVGFDICLKKFVSDGVNGFSLFGECGMDHWDTICQQTLDKNILATALVHNMVESSCTIPSTKRLWSSLIDSYIAVNQIEKLVHLIICNIELILFSNERDFFYTVEEKFLREWIFPEIDSLKLKKSRIKQVGEQRKKELTNLYQYKLDDWIGL